MRPSTFINCLAATLLIILTHVGVTAQGDTLDVERILRSTVYIMQARSVGDELLISCVGSGTIVSRDGLILTNAHNTLKSPACPGEVLIIALTSTIDEPPVAQYRAEITQANAGLDLALLRINGKLDGRLVEGNTLALPFVELADSSTMKLDETITIVGYPSIGNESVTAVRGTITGFVFEPRSINSGAAWIKTSGNIPGTMSGGGAYNQNSQLIGVPTTTPLTAQANPSANCVSIQDTNRDRLINTDDQCIAVGVFINALRPSNFARSLLRGATLGLTVEVQGDVSEAAQAVGAPEFSRLFFAASVNEAGMPSTVISSLPAGSTGLYLFFDYQNMTSETVYELRVTTNGIPNPTFSLAPVRWSGGQQGMWYIGSSGQPWPNGIYEFTLFANGIASSTKRLVIGEAPASTAVLSDIVFGLLDSRGNPQGNGFVLPSGTIASARFIYRNMQDGMNWSAIWYLDDIEFQRVSNNWDAGTNGSQTTSIEVTEGLPPGRYRLELYVEDRLSATSDFTIAGAQNGALAQIFTNLYSTTASSDTEAIRAAPINNFSDTISTLYVLFDWQQIAPGTLWTLRWLVDGEIFFDQTTPWNNARDGDHFVTQLISTDRIPDGTYAVELLVSNLKLASTTVQVGIGQLPIDRFARASGVQMRGQILDRETRRGIAGVTIVIISAEFSVEEFQWQQNQVFALATTDSQGAFEIDRPLELSTPDRTIAYSALVAADGYLPISADGVEVTTDTANPLNLILYLSRD